MYFTIIISLLIGLLCISLSLFLARRFRLYDTPVHSDAREQARPLFGGFGLLAGMFLGLGVFAWYNFRFTTGEAFDFTREFEFTAPLAAAMLLSAIVGLIDDAGALKPLPKLLALLPGAIIAGVLWPEELSVLLWAILIIGFLFLTNAVNLLDTIDGLTGVMTATSALGLGVMALTVGRSEVAIGAGAMAGACIAFLFFNWRFILPAAISPGSMGSLALGSGLAVFVVYLFQQAQTPADQIAAYLPVGLVGVNALLTVYICKQKSCKALARTKDCISERLFRAGVPRWEITAWLGIANLITVAAGTVAWMNASVAGELLPLGVGLGVLGALAYYIITLDLPSEEKPIHREKMICRIITRMDVGGPSQHCVYLAKGLEAYGWQTVLIHGSIDPDREKSMKYLAEKENVNTYHIPAMQREIRPLADLQALWHLYLTIRRLRPQIVHTHHAKAGALGRIAAALCNVPIIVHTFHGISLRDYFGPIKNRVFLTVEQICARISTILISTGPNDRDELVEIGVAPPEKLVVIPLGLPLQALAEGAQKRRGELREELGISSDELLVVYVGRLVPIKNVPAFIDMAANVLQQRGNVHFALFGEGPLREDLQQQVDDLAIDNHVSFYGVTDAVERVYADADMLVLCSHREGMSLVVMEALATAVPVVSTRVGDVTNSLIEGITGRLVPPNNTEALTAAVLETLDDMSRSREMAQTGQEHVLHSFSIEALSKRIHTLYEALIEGREYMNPVPVRQQAIQDDRVKIDV